MHELLAYNRFIIEQCIITFVCVKINFWKKCTQKLDLCVQYFKDNSFRTYHISRKLIKET